jgi:hypothetical protein
MPRVRRGGPVVVLLKFRVVCSGCQQHAGSRESHCEPITFQIKGKRAFGRSIPPRAPWEHMNCWPLDTGHLFGKASEPWQWAVEKQETWGDAVNRQRQWGDRAPLSSRSECTCHRFPSHGQSHTYLEHSMGLLKKQWLWFRDSPWIRWKLKRKKMYGVVKMTAICRSRTTSRLSLSVFLLPIKKKNDKCFWPSPLCVWETREFLSFSL